jgi:hypothetical protein
MNGEPFLVCAAARAAAPGTCRTSQVSNVPCRPSSCRGCSAARAQRHASGLEHLAEGRGDDHSGHRLALPLGRERPAPTRGHIYGSVMSANGTRAARVLHHSVSDAIQGRKRVAGEPGLEEHRGKGHEDLRERKGQRSREGRRGRDEKVQLFFESIQGYITVPKRSLHGRRIGVWMCAVMR